MVLFSAKTQMFLLTYFSMFARHAIIGTWSVSKPMIQKDLGLIESDFGNFEFLFLILYAVGNYFSGALVDVWSARAIVSVGLMLSSCSIFTVRLTQIVIASEFGSANHVLVLLLWGLAGLFQSAAWPGGISVVSSWYDKSSHGVVLGMWSTNSPAGSIFGQQLAGFMIGVMLLTWQAAVSTACLLAFLVGILYFILVRIPNFPSCPPQSIANTHKSAIGKAFRIPR
mmetsp:Transcript_29020/g.51906  ORF Transcript_29020/g.51906 Transcript_29020/m.51906 type:complete len:226 (-) Transcript_29020:788-1465(-)